MGTLQEAATELLSHRRIAVTGVSRKPKGHGRTSYTGASPSEGTRCSRSTRTRMRWRGIRATTT
jgi:hypothetical protein